MARPIIWPSAPVPDQPAAAASCSPFAGIDLGGVAAALGPELSRLSGFRIGAVAGGPAGSEPLFRICRIRLKLAAGVRAIDVDLPARATAMWMERLFGASAAQAAEAPMQSLAALPPGSACWATLCRHIARSLGRAFEANEVLLGGGPLLPPRAAHPPGEGGADAIFALDIDGTPALLALAAEALPAAPPPAAQAPDPALWRAEARARALDLELPVTLRLSETRVALATVAPLRAGDILPLDRPRTLDLLVEGRRVGRLPAASFLPSEPERNDR